MMPETITAEMWGALITGVIFGYLFGYCMAGAIYYSVLKKGIK